MPKQPPTFNPNPLGFNEFEKIFESKMQQALLLKKEQSEKKVKKTIDYKKHLEICFFVNGKPISKYNTIYEVFSKYLTNPLAFSVIKLNISF
jgi:hypothetical protein